MGNCETNMATELADIASPAAGATRSTSPALARLRPYSWDSCSSSSSSKLWAWVEEVEVEQEEGECQGSQESQGSLESQAENDVPFKDFTSYKRRSDGVFNQFKISGNS